MADASLHDPGELLDALVPRLADRPFWLRRVEACLTAGTGARMHLAIFHEPFLRLLLEGAKTVESRFSVNRVVPYLSIGRDDLILLKRNAGPVVGIALAGDPGFYELDADAWQAIRLRFAAAICAPDEGFWTQRAQARYGTLIPVRATASFTPLSVAKRDRRGWVVIDSAPSAQGTLEKALEA